MQYGEFTYDRKSGGYYARHKLSNGQYCMIGLMEYYNNRTTDYWVVFAVANKKKNLNGYFDETKDNNITLKMTGTCGVEALFWAKKMLIESGEKSKIIVTGEDARRFHLYERALPRLGYYKSCVDGQMAMIKTFYAEDEIENDLSGSCGYYTDPVVSV